MLLQSVLAHFNIGGSSRSISRDMKRKRHLPTGGRGWWASVNRIERILYATLALNEATWVYDVADCRTLALQSRLQRLFGWHITATRSATLATTTEVMCMKDNRYLELLLQLSTVLKSVLESSRRALLLVRHTSNISDYMPKQWR